MSNNFFFFKKKSIKAGEGACLTACRSCVEEQRRRSGFERAGRVDLDQSLDEDDLLDGSRETWWLVFVRSCATPFDGWWWGGGLLEPWILLWSRWEYLASRCVATSAWEVLINQPLAHVREWSNDADEEVDFDGRKHLSDRSRPKCSRSSKRRKASSGRLGWLGRWSDHHLWYDWFVWKGRGGTRILLQEVGWGFETPGILMGRPPVPAVE